VGSRRWFLVAALAVLAAFVNAGSPDPAHAADGTRVQMVDNDPDLTSWHFDPAQLTVPAGATVVWVNQGKEDHSVTADDKSFDSGLKKSGTSFQRVFPRTGSFSYHCEPHPWMTGTIQVVAAPTTTSAPAATSTAPPATAAPGPSATATSFPPSAATEAPSETTTSAPASNPDDSTAAPASSRKRSGGRLAGTIALVLGPTLGGLALGAKLRRRRA
jgi:plastocyanin